MDLQELRSELDEDPEGLGYAGTSDAEAAATLNDRSLTGETALREAIPMGEVYAQVEWTTEWAGLDATFREGFRQLTSTPTLDASSSRIHDALEAIFGSDSQTWANLAAIAERSVSRAEVLWGAGTRVHHLDVARARRL